MGFLSFFDNFKTSFPFLAAKLSPAAGEGGENAGRWLGWSLWEGFKEISGFVRMRDEFEIIAAIVSEVFRVHYGFCCMLYEKKSFIYNTKKVNSNLTRTRKLTIQLS